MAMQNMPTSAPPTTGGGSIVDRLMGVITLKAPVYREIADDTTATGQAAAIVVVVAVIVGLIGGFVFSSVFGAAGVAVSPIGFAVRSILQSIVGWVIGAWVFAFVSRTFFGGRTNTGEMLRVFGFTQIFAIIGIIPILGLIALVLSIIGAVIGIREASEFDTGKAVLTGIVGLIVLFVVYTIIGIILGAVGLG